MLYYLCECEAGSNPLTYINRNNISADKSSRKGAFVLVFPCSRFWRSPLGVLCTSPKFTTGFYLYDILSIYNFIKINIQN